ncbi:NAD(P)-binding protein [Nonomuraea rhizosphaerae]|uniref:NAD(P)-binding protein n=1 Tax=Nonomuraea rhizosphaerae TaxID=2665663 RepID=UPI001FEC9CA1|nr:NAD(P)-binding protein [Nonomuraea rhizosphaerae]
MSDMNASSAHDLGMDRPISRRDFFDGVAMSVGAAALVTACAPLQGGAGAIGTRRLRVPKEAASPAGLTGLQGNTAQALSVPHAMRDDRFWPYAGTPQPTGEQYDLVVVGGGISGVSAAFEWQFRNPDARILILDNHDEIGGHARRNEFRPAGRPGPLVGCGGSRSIQAHSAWTAEGKLLLGRLGVEPEKLGGYLDRQLYAGLGMYGGVMCDRETFGTERLVRLPPGLTPRQWTERLPIAEQARKDLLTLYESPPDWFPGLTPEQKEERLAALTYSDFLLKVCRAHPDVELFCRTMSSAEWAYGTQAFGAIDAWSSGYPGFQGLGLDSAKPSRYSSPSLRKEWQAGDAYHFPEGNQALVRMMVGRMIPGFAGATDMDGVTTTSYDYGRLDQSANPVRFRLSSPVVSVSNDGPPGTATTATVGYFDGHGIRSVRAGSVVLACWNTMIPYLVTDLPYEQKQALREAVKTPLVSATVQVRGWEAWRRLGLSRARWTGAYWCVSELDQPVSMPGYHAPRGPYEPVNVHLTAAPCRSELGPGAGSVAGRHALLKTPYHHLEFTIRDQLARLLGPGGFDPGADIEAITVNRWGHGYAPEYCRPWHAFYPDGPFPADTARRRHGRIAIANSDSVPAARADAAITAAHRAVADLSV